MANQLRLCGFQRQSEFTFAPKTRLEERTVLAMFYNNRAADALARERLGEAYAHIRLGIQVDPGFAASTIPWV